MNKFFRFGLLLATCGVLWGQAHASDEPVEKRVVAIDGRVVRVKLDGVIDLKVRQGATPGLVIYGEKRYLDKTMSSTTGDTLHLETEGRGIKIGRNMVRAELVLSMLREVVSDGVGTTEITGFSGDELELTLDGAGSMKVNCDYKHLKADLGGVGKMNLWVSENDNVELDLRGAGYITLGGRSKNLRASLSGLGGLNAQQMQADSVNVDLSGLGNATVNALNNVTLSLNGLGSVTVYGKPLNRNVSVDGLGKVSWK